MVREDPGQAGAEGDEPLTQIGRRVLTPEYAAPEQVRGEQVTVAADGYALGALLYELLAGRRAHRFAEYTPAEIERVVCQVEPEPPSAVVRKPLDGSTPETVSAARGTIPERLSRRLADDLDTIVLAALQKDPARRYPTVDALIADLERHQAGLPIRARPDSAAYRVRKFVRRHRIGIVALVAVLLSLVGGLAGTIWQARVAARQATRATAAKEFLAATFTQADPGHALGDSLTAGEMLDRARRGLDTAFAAQPDLRFDLLLTLGRIYRDLGRFAGADSVFSRAVALADSVPGVGAAAAIPWYMLGSVRLGTGVLPAAESLTARALGIVRRHRGADSVLAQALDVRGSVQNSLSQFAAAESSYREAIVAAERARLDSAVLGSLWQNLNVALSNAGRVAASDSALGRALAIQRRHLPPEHPSLLLSLGSLASRRAARWEMDSAIALAEDLLARQRRIYPAGHQRVAIAMNNLASYRMRVGDYQAAEAGFREAHGLMERLHGAGHPTTLILLNNVVRVLLLKGQPAEAEIIMEQLLRQVHQSLAPEHPFRSQALYWLGRVYDAEGRSARALVALDSALAMAIRLLPPEHPRASDTRVALGAIHLREGRLADAEAALRTALGWRVAHLEPLAPEIAEAALVLARCRAEQGARVESDSLFEDGIRRFEANPYRTREAEAARRELEGWRTRWR